MAFAWLTSRTSFAGSGEGPTSTNPGRPRASTEVDEMEGEPKYATKADLEALQKQLLALLKERQPKPDFWMSLRYR